MAFKKILFGLFETEKPFLTNFVSQTDSTLDGINSPQAMPSFW